MSIQFWHSPDGVANLPRLKQWSAQSSEFKALSTGTPTAGGYLVADEALAQIIEAERASNVVRALATTLPLLAAGASRSVPSVEAFMSDAEWTPELSFGPEDTALSFGARRLTPHALAKHIRASKDMAYLPGFETIIRDLLARSVANAQEAAFINGSGAAEPLGIIRTPSLPTFTTTTAAEVYGDDVISWLYSLPAKYRRKASILASTAFVRKIRSLSKPNTGGSFSNYDAAPAFAPATDTSPARLEGVPIYESDGWPTIVSGADAWLSGACVAVVLDASFYYVQDSLDLTVQHIVELLAESNRDAWAIRQETDAMLVLPEAAVALVVA